MSAPEKKFAIPFVGLKNGVHEFKFQVDGSFFGEVEKSLISQCEVDIDLEFDKKDSLFALLFDVGGTVNVECDRCLEPFDYPIGGEYKVYVKYESERSELDDQDDVVYISKGSSILDVKSMIHDFILLSIPMQKAHPVGENGEFGCSPEILDLLSKHANLGQDDETDEAANEENIDPRWNKLKDIIKK